MKMHIHYDKEADYLEVRFGKATRAYFEELSKDIFERRDEKTGKIKGYAVYNFLKRKQPKDIQIELPVA